MRYMVMRGHGSLNTLYSNSCKKVTRIGTVKTPTPKGKNEYWVICLRNLKNKKLK